MLNDTECRNTKSNRSNAKPHSHNSRLTIQNYNIPKKMKKILICISCLIIIVYPSYAQEIFTNSQYGISIQTPTNWITADNKDLIKNLDKYDLSDESLTSIIKNNKGSLLLSAFYKYDVKAHPGLIPTIQINVRTLGNVDFKTFKEMTIQSTEAFKKYFEDFEFEEKPHEIEISGIKSMAFIGKFTMKSSYGQEIKVRSRTIAIPYKNYFFQLNFTDGQFEEDSSALFEELIKTIKIGKEKNK